MLFVLHLTSSVLKSYDESWEEGVKGNKEGGKKGEELKGVCEGREDEREWSIHEREREREREREPTHLATLSLRLSTDSLLFISANLDLASKSNEVDESDISRLACPRNLPFPFLSFRASSHM